MSFIELWDVDNQKYYINLNNVLRIIEIQRYKEIIVIMSDSKELRFYGEQNDDFNALLEFMFKD